MPRVVKGDAMKRTLILITGSPAAGKTTLATKISEKLNIPVFYRDRITEVLWDAPAPSEKVPNQFGPASAEIIFHIIEQFMKSNNSVIIESYWNYSLANDRLLNLKQKYNYNAITIRLFGEPDILYRRFYARQQTSERHEGLKGTPQMTLEQFIAKIENTECNKIDIGGTIMDIDTSDFSKVNFEQIIRGIESKYQD